MVACPDSPVLRLLRPFFTPSNAGHKRADIGSFALFVAKIRVLRGVCQAQRLFTRGKIIAAIKVNVFPMTCGYKKYDYRLALGCHDNILIPKALCWKVGA